MAETHEASSTWKGKILLVGALIGALIGVGGAYLLIQNAEKHGREVNITTGDGLKLSLSLMSFLRQIAQLGEGEKS